MEGELLRYCTNTLEASSAQKLIFRSEIATELFDSKKITDKTQKTHAETIRKLIAKDYPSQNEQTSACKYFAAHPEMVKAYCEACDKPSYYFDEGEQEIWAEFTGCKLISLNTIGSNPKTFTSSPGNGKKIEEIVILLNPIVNGNPANSKLGLGDHFYRLLPVE